MNQNIVIGILVVLILAAGGYYFFVMNPSTPGTAATSTVQTTTNTTGTETGTTAGAPAVTTDTSVAPTNSTAVVTGSVNPEGAQTSYWYEYGPSATLGQKTASQTIGSGFDAIPSPGYITGLGTNTLYYFRLTAQNAYGTVSGTTYSFSTNNNPAGQGVAPAVSTNSAGDITRGSVTLNASVNAHSSQTTFWFEYGTDTNFGQVTAFQSGGSANGSISVSAPVSGLNPLTTYYFRVNAQNQYGTVNGTTRTFTTTGPSVSVAPVVTTQVASPVAASSATLRGTVNPNNIPTTYWFEYSTDSLLGSVLLKTTAQNSAGTGGSTISISANLSGLLSGTAYYYRTVAQNSAGTVRGDTQTFTTN